MHLCFTIPSGIEGVTIVLLIKNIFVSWIVKYHKHVKIRKCKKNKSRKIPNDYTHNTYADQIRTSNKDNILIATIRDSNDDRHPTYDINVV